MCGCGISKVKLLGTLDDWMMLGDQAMEENDPYGALRYYKTGMELDSMKGTLIYKVAEAYRGVQNYEKATYYYDKIFACLGSQRVL